MYLAGDDLIGSLRVQTMDDDVSQRKEEQGIRCLPERDKYLERTEEEKDGEEAGKRSDRKQKKSEHSSTSKKLVTTNGLTEGYIPKGETETMSSTQSCSAHLLAMEPAGVSSRHCLISQPASPATVSFLPHLLHLTAEEIAASPGIEAETFPELSLIESLAETHRSHMSLKSSPRSPEMKLRASAQPAAMFSEEVVSNHYSGVRNGPLKGSLESDQHHKRPTPSPRKTRLRAPEATYSSHSHFLKSKHQTTSPDREPRTPRARSNAAGVDESR